MSITYPTVDPILRGLLRKIDEPPIEDIQAIKNALYETYREGHKLLHQPPGYTHLVEQNIELKQQRYDSLTALKAALPILTAGHPENIPSEVYDKARDLVETALDQLEPQSPRQPNNLTKRG